MTFYRDMSGPLPPEERITILAARIEALIKNERHHAHHGAWSRAFWHAMSGLASAEQEATLDGAAHLLNRGHQ